MRKRKNKNTENKPKDNRKNGADYKSPSRAAYGFARFAGFLCARLLFHPEIRKNELRNAKGPFVLLANHECAFDAAVAIGLTRRKMTFVLSHAFCATIPFQRIVRGMHVIEKQQFQTRPSDLRAMKAVIRAGEGLCLYPAGLMTGDGLSTPVPEGTYSLLKWLGADVYAARITGSYFVMPKWSGKCHPGKTGIVAEKLFSKEELETLSPEEIKVRVLDALWFDAYEDQEKHPEPYKNINRVAGLETVLYRCPECGKKHTIAANGTSLSCLSCGFTEEADEYGFLHLRNGKQEYRHVTEWRRKIRELEEEELGPDPYRIFPCRVSLLNEAEHRFPPAEEEGELILTAKEVCLKTEGRTVTKDIRTFPTLPFKPGKTVDIQDQWNVNRLSFREPGTPAEVTDLVEILHRRGSV